MTPELIEAVARRICEAEKMNSDDPLGGWIHWTDAAKAAIDEVLTGARYRAAIDAVNRLTAKGVSLSRETATLRIENARLRDELFLATRDRHKFPPV